MTFKELDQYSKGLVNLAAAEIKDFKLKIKVAKLSIWQKAQVNFLNAGVEAVKAGGNKQEEFKKLLAEKIEATDIKITESEIENIDLTGSDISDLVLLGILDLNQ